jgi:hypothetical protein
MKQNHVIDETYDVVETAIELSKTLHGTWESLIQGKRVKPWALENDVQNGGTHAVPNDESDVVVIP